MKKNTGKIFILLTLLAAMTACGKKETAAPEPSTAVIETTTEGTTAEPVKAVDSPEPFLDFNVFIDVPKESEDVSYSILNGNTAQIDFQYAETRYVLRGSNVNEDLTFDVNDEYKEVMDSISDGTRKVDIRTTVGGCRVAEWVYEGTNFALISQQPVSDDSFNQLCLWLSFPE